MQSSSSAFSSASGRQHDGDATYNHLFLLFISVPSDHLIRAGLSDPSSTSSTSSRRFQPPHGVPAAVSAFYGKPSSIPSIPIDHHSQFPTLTHFLHSSAFIRRVCLRLRRGSDDAKCLDDVAAAAERGAVAEDAIVAAATAEEPTRCRPHVLRSAEVKTSAFSWFWTLRDDHCFVVMLVGCCVIVGCLASWIWVSGNPEIRSGIRSDEWGESLGFYRVTFHLLQPCEITEMPLPDLLFYCSTFYRFPFYPFTVWLLLWLFDFYPLTLTVDYLTVDFYYLTLLPFYLFKKGF